MHNTCTLIAVVCCPCVVGLLVELIIFARLARIILSLVCATCKTYFVYSCFMFVSCVWALVCLVLYPCGVHVYCLFVYLPSTPCIYFFYLFSLSFIEFSAGLLFIIYVYYVHLPLLSFFCGFPLFYFQLKSSLFPFDISFFSFLFSSLFRLLRSIVFHLTVHSLLLFLFYFGKGGEVGAATHIPFPPFSARKHINAQNPVYVLFPRHER